MAWNLEHDLYTSSHKDCTLAVDPHGGRISSITLEGNEALAVKDARQTGSTFWTAPQSDWSWPPVAEHDSLPYAEKSREPLVLEGKADPTLGIAITKSFTWLDNGLLQLGYRMDNHGSSPRAAAPWEITRVPPGGLSIFPSGDPSQTRGDLDLEHESGYSFFQHRGEDQRKLFAHAASGWLAHLGTDLALLKVFPPVQPKDFAPKEALIELYGAFDYVEVEQQGPFTVIPPGGSASWTILWQLIRADRLPGTRSELARRLDDLAGELRTRWLKS